MKNRKKSHKVTSALLFALSAILVAASIAGYAARTNGGTRENLNEMRTYAVMHAATMVTLSLIGITFPKMNRNRS